MNIIFQLYIVCFHKKTKKKSKIIFFKQNYKFGFLCIQTICITILKYKYN